MSIEKDLSRIATALEAIANQMAAANGATAQAVETPAPPAPMTQAQVEVTPTATVTPITPPAPPSDPVITKEMLNDLCKKKFTDLGSADKIVALFTEFGVQGVAQLPEDKHSDFRQKLLALV